MGSHAVSLLILSGTSDSSGATRAYMSSASQLDHADLRMPDGGPIHQGFFVTSTLGNATVPVTDVPTIQMPSQSEVRRPVERDAGRSARRVQYRRPDSDAPGNQFRIYEVAGMSHNDARENPAFEGCTHPLSHFPHGALTFMGLQHLLDWSASAPSRRARPTWKLRASSPTARVSRSTSTATRKAGAQHLPRRACLHFTIPNSGPGLCSQGPRLDHAVLGGERSRAALPQPRGYVSRIQHRLKELLDEGWFPREYADEYPRADIKLAK